MSRKRQKCLLKYSEKYNIIHINESIYAGKKIKKNGKKKRCRNEWGIEEGMWKGLEKI